MFRQIVLSAVGAGLAVGLAVAALQQVTTTPLIIEAEVFETAATSLPSPQTNAASDRLPIAQGAQAAEIVEAGEHGHEAQAWAPEDGIERTFYTALTTVLSATGFGLMLLAAMVLHGGRIDARSGLIWGACGFAAASLAPALGLPPELPGSAAAELADRQLWWLGTIVATAGAIALLAFSKPWWPKALAVALIAAPHVIGAPRPASFTSTAPAELAGHFASASLVVGAVFWVMLGWAVATLFTRLAPAE